MNPKIVLGTLGAHIIASLSDIKGDLFDLKETLPQFELPLGIVPSCPRGQYLNESITLLNVGTILW